MIEVADIVDTFTHNGSRWTIVLINGAYYARDNHGSDTGPYSTPEQAFEWVKAIQP